MTTKIIKTPNGEAGLQGVACCYCPGLVTAAEGLLLYNYSPALAGLPVHMVLLSGVMCLLLP